MGFYDEGAAGKKYQLVRNTSIHAIPQRALVSLLDVLKTKNGKM